MITLERLMETGKDFGIHCPTRADAELLVGYIYERYPYKYNKSVNMLDIWDDYKEDTIIYPNLNNYNWINYGRVGGPASFRRPIYEFSELETPLDLPIEPSDMDINYMLGL